MNSNERNARRLRAADYLLDEIGNVDDRFLAEADTPYRPSARGFGWRRVLILAATLGVLFSLLLCVFVGSMLAGILSNKSGDDNIRDDVNADENTVTSYDLNGMLLSLKDQATPIYTEEELELTGSVSMVIWRYTGEEGYRARYLSESECARLMDTLSHSKGTPVSPDGKANEVQVWIALGDGRIISPCLKESNGNVAFGTLFDYDPEVEPSADFVTALYDTLK